MLVSLGLDHRGAGVELRERFLLEEEELPRVYDALAGVGAGEAVLTRTCNRVELYCWWSEPAVGPETAHGIARAWVGGGGREAEALLAHAWHRAGPDVARHLLRVAGGLESQVLGDIHILGQVRRAFRSALEARSAGSNLHRLFELALRIGKQVQRETSLMAARHGVGSAVARAAEERLVDLAGRSCVVVGCGKGGAHSARCLLERGADRITLVNRTPERAERLARELGRGEARGLDALPQALASADVVVVATGAPQPVLTGALLDAARRPARPLLVIDVGVPRNVEPAVGSRAGVELLDLDTLLPETAAVESSRRAAVPEAEALVETGVEEFLRWLELNQARQALDPLRAVLAEVCRKELTHLAGASPGAQRAVDRIVAGVMARPMSALRCAAERGEGVGEAADALRDLFTRPNSSSGELAPSTS